MDRADMTTTRETADHIGEANEKVADHIGEATTMIDHAELAACPFCGGPHLKHITVYSEDEPTWQIAWQVFCETCHARGPASVRIGWCETEPDASFAWNRRPEKSDLLSEIAALRGDLTEARVAADLLVSSVRADLRQAERQRDEAVGLLRELWQSVYYDMRRSPAAPITLGTIQKADAARAFLANQGADQ